MKKVTADTLQNVTYVLYIIFSFSAAIIFLFGGSRLKSTEIGSSFILFILAFLVLRSFIDKLNASSMIRREMRSISVDVNTIKNDIFSLKIDSIPHKQESYIGRQMHLWNEWATTMAIAPLHKHSMVNLLREDAPSHNTTQEYYNSVLSESEREFLYCYHAWCSVIDRHFLQQYAELRKKNLTTKSDYYVELVRDMTFYLSSLYKESEFELVRFHITGMLPEEFFNGPQIEYTNWDSTPIFFCHIWEQEGYKSAFYDVKEQKEICEIHRCILVRQQGMANSSSHYLSALSTFNDLSEQSSLYIRNANAVPMSLLERKEYSGSAIRLIQHARHKCREFIEIQNSTTRELENLTDHDYRSFISEIVGSGRYHFYPIYMSTPDEAHIDRNLVVIFSQYFQSSSDFSYYYSIDDSMMDLIGQINGIDEKYFDRDHMPEICLFGIRQRNKTGIDSCRWIFSVKGKYKPYSRDIEIQIYGADDTQVMVTDFSFALETAARGDNKLCNILSKKPKKV